MCNLHRFLYRRYAKFLTCKNMDNFKPIKYVNFNRLKTVNMEQKFMFPRAEYNANQALCLPMKLFRQKLQPFPTQ